MNKTFLNNNNFFYRKPGSRLHLHWKAETHIVVVLAPVVAVIQHAANGAFGERMSRHPGRAAARVASVDLLGFAFE